MARSRKSAKSAGGKFERLMADYLSKHVDDRIDRRVKTGSKDRGDIAGLRHQGQKVVVECKDVTRWSPGTWFTEAEIERINDDALSGMVFAKRHGNANAGDQIVMMTARDLVALLTGRRPIEDLVDPSILEEPDGVEVA